MGVQGYREVLRLRVVRQILGLGLFIRIPMWASAIVLTLHVVDHLGRSYTEAGLLVTVATLATAVSGPWRGRLLDRFGLRRTVLPSLVVLTGCWSVAPFVGYWLLMPLAGVAGLFVVPTFSVVRQVVINAVDDERRTTALALDSVAVELSYMAGPALGVWLSVSVDTPVALLLCEFASIVGGAALWVLDPALPSARTVAIGEQSSHPQQGDPSDPAAARPATERWMSPTVLAVLAASMTATVVLTGTDVSVVAALRQWDQQGSIGWVLAVWGAGSAIGGLAYGAISRPISPFVLIGALGLTTAATALAQDRVTACLLLFVAGLCCAPTITATIDTLSRAVPERVRGEAMGWHGSALTVGSALGAPAVGFVLDRVGWHGGFLAAGAIGVLIGALGWTVAGIRRGHGERRGRSGSPAAQSLQAGVPPGS